MFDLFFLGLSVGAVSLVEVRQRVRQATSVRGLKLLAYEASSYLIVVGGVSLVEVGQRVRQALCKNGVVVACERVHKPA